MDKDKKYELEQRLVDMKPYEPLKGTYDIRLDANESYFKIPNEVVQEFKKALDDIKYNRYPDPYATELCKGFAKHLNINAENIMAGNGSDEIINLIIEAFLKDGDTVLTLRPDFSMYEFYSFLRRANLAFLETNPSKAPEVSDILEAVKINNPKILILSNPCNPTGQVIKKDEVIRLVKNIDSLVIIDEAYMDFSNETIVYEIENLPNVIVLRTLSKAFAAASLRLGFAVANKTLIDTLKKVKAPYNINSVSQKFGSILLSHSDKYSKIIEEILEYREELYRELSGISNLLGCEFKAYKPNANFIYIETKQAKKIYESLLKKGIAIRYFSNGALRITVGNKEENKAVLKELRGI